MPAVCLTACVHLVLAEQLALGGKDQVGSLCQKQPLGTLVTPLKAACLLQAKRGGLKDCPADDMFAAVLAATLDRSGVEPEVGLSCLCLHSKSAEGSTFPAAHGYPMMQCIRCTHTAPPVSQLSLL